MHRAVKRGFKRAALARKCGGSDFEFRAPRFVVGKRKNHLHLRGSIPCRGRLQQSQCIANLSCPRIGLDGTFAPFDTIEPRRQLEQVGSNSQEFVVQNVAGFC